MMEIIFSVIYVTVFIYISTLLAETKDWKRMFASKPNNI